MSHHTFYCTHCHKLLKQLTIAVLLAGNMPLVAKSVSVSHAKVLAWQFLMERPVKTGGLRAPATEELTLITSGSDALCGYPLYHLFSRGTGRGFVIAAGDDCVTSPVLGYSDEGTVSSDTMPYNMKCWLAHCEECINAAITQHKSIGPSPRRAPDTKADIEPLIHSKWGQWAPFNDLCPTNADGTKVPTGCVATAMAQIMYYHRWPKHGKGEKEYTTSIDNTKITLSANFAETTYQWDKMVDDYSQPDISEEARRAVAQLMLDCGISVSMNYEVDGSGAQSDDVPVALKSYFDYGTDINGVNIVSERDLNGLYFSLQRGLPAYFTGNNKQQDSPHAFVCDGYCQGGYYHFNWGWLGKFDGFFLLDGMTLYEGYDFSYLHKIYYNIHKPYESDGFIFNIIGGTNGECYDSIASIIGYTDELAAISTIPATFTYDGIVFPVTRFSGISNCEWLEELSIPANIILAGSVKNCKNFQKLILLPADSVLSFMTNALREIKDLEVYRPFTSRWRTSVLEQLILGGMFEWAQPNIFAGHSKLQKITVKDGLKTIIPDAFYNCSELQSIDIAASVDSVAKFFNEKSTKLKEVHVHWLNPEVVRTISDMGFPEGCVLYVPLGTKEKYRKLKFWGIADIREDDADLAVSDLSGNSSVSCQLADGQLVITGIDTPTLVTISNLSGRLLYSRLCSNGVTIPVPKGQTLIVKVGTSYYRKIQNVKGDL